MTYLTNETGAVTVDWVVLTAGLVGLGLAAMTVVSSGVQDASGDTKAQMEGQIIYSSFASTSEDFANGQAGGFSGGNALTVSGFGDILRFNHSDGLEAVSQTFDIPEGTEQAVMTFDVLAMDSLDSNSNDGVTLYLDGQVIGTGTAALGNEGLLDWTFEDVEGVTIATELKDSNRNIGSKGWNDSIYGVTVTVEDPSETVSLGFGTRAAQGAGDESVGIDNFNIQTAGLGA